VPRLPGDRPVRARGPGRIHGQSCSTGATPAASVRAGQVNIPDAAKMACCGSIEVVQLVLNGKLKRKWKLAVRISSSENVTRQAAVRRRLMDQR